jgi:hypothetical protein
MTTNMYASGITAATLRVAGEIPTDVTISHLGSPEQEASLRIGELLVYVRNACVVEHVAELWSQNRAITSALPHVAGPSRLQLPIRVGLVAVVVRLGGRPSCTAGWVAGRPGVAQPPHVRVDIGPVAFEVCDQAAWHTLGRAWNLVRRQLAAVEE